MCQSKIRNGAGDSACPCVAERGDLQCPHLPATLTHQRGRGHYRCVGCCLPSTNLANLVRTARVYSSLCSTTPTCNLNILGPTNTTTFSQIPLLHNHHCNTVHYSCSSFMGMPIIRAIGQGSQMLNMEISKLNFPTGLMLLTLHLFKYPVTICMT